MLDVSDLASVDWPALRGAYGPSTGDHRDVAGALRTLATDLDPSSDGRSDALDIVLWSHGYHQGSIYDVTAAIVPFVVAWIDRGYDIDGELETGLIAIASAATDPRNEGPARAVGDAFAACAGAILHWHDDHAQAVSVIGALVPAMRARWLESLDRDHLGDLELLALATLAPPPAWAVEYARRQPGTVGAAILLARDATLDPELARTVEAALGPKTVATYADVLERLHLEVPTVRAPFAGELVAATVVFVGPRLVLVSVDGRNVTLRLASSGLRRGDEVRIGMSPHGEPRVVELRTPDGELETIELRA